MFWLLFTSPNLSQNIFLLILGATTSLVLCQGLQNIIDLQIEKEWNKPAIYLVTVLFSLDTSSNFTSSENLCWLHLLPLILQATWPVLTVFLLHVLYPYIYLHHCFINTCLVLGVKNLPAVQEMEVWSLGWGDPLKKEMATHSSILAWENVWTDEPGGLQSMGLQKSRTWLSKLNRTIVIICFDLGSIPALGRFPEGGHGNPLRYSCLENPHGQRSLVSCSPWGHRVGHNWATKHNTTHPYVYLHDCFINTSLPSRL